MIETDNYTQLHHYEHEDIFDVIIKLEKSFGITFQKNSFENVQTFGDVCDVFMNLIQAESDDDCSTQQAFYKIRYAISETLLINKNNIVPDTKLEDLFPRENRRQKLKEFQTVLGISFQILNIKSWLGSTIFMGIVASLIMFL